MAVAEGGGIAFLMWFELPAGLAAACALAWVLAGASRGVFLGVVFGLAVVLLPAVAVAVLGSWRHSLAGLVIVLVPPLAAGCRRVSREQWRIGRGLGGGRWFCLRTLVLPRMLPFVAVALVAGGVLLGIKARLERLPAGSIQIEEPATGMG